MKNSIAITTDNSINQTNHPNTEDSQNDEKEDTRYSQDSRRLLALLPPEVWDHICTFLDSTDFLNLANSSLVFRDLFLRHRVIFLYKPVLVLLLPKLTKYSETNFLEYFPHKENQMNIRSLLGSCRKVCKTWKWAIDEMARNITPEELQDENLVHDLLSKNYTFTKSRQIDQFLQHFEISHSSNINPFPGKYIYVHMRLTDPDYPQLINRLSILFEKYGQHIWTFKTRTLFHFGNPQELHNKIVEWLNCMPNLQTLLISCTFPLRPENFTQFQVECLPSKLKSLRNLAIETFCSTIPDHWIPESSWVERYNLSKLIYQHDNLDYLKLTIFNKRDAAIFESFTSPLKTLSVQYHCKEDVVNLSEIIRGLSEKFSGTLENLFLTYRITNKTSWYMNILQDSFKCRLNLPKLRKFEMNLLCQFSLDFLLGMTENLEELIVNCATLEDFDYNAFSEVEKEVIGFIESKQVIQFLGYQNKMLESNIWSLFPKLQKITLTPSIDGSFLSREEWARRQQLG